jgi:hypothetical protein
MFHPKQKEDIQPSLPNKKQIPGTLEEWEDSVLKISTNQQLALKRKSIVLYIYLSGVGTLFLPHISLCKSMGQTFGQVFNACSRVKNISACKNLSPKTIRGHCAKFAKQKTNPWNTGRMKKPRTKNLPEPTACIKEEVNSLVHRFPWCHAPFLPIFLFVNQWAKLLANYSMLAQGSKKFRTQNCLTKFDKQKTNPWNTGRMGRLSTKSLQKPTTCIKEEVNSIVHILIWCQCSISP